MITLDVADLVVIAGQALGTGPEAALAQLDIAAAQAALALVHSPDPTSPDPTSPDPTSPTPRHLPRLLLPPRLLLRPPPA